MKLLCFLLGVMLLASCDSSTEQREPVLGVYKAGWRASDGVVTTQGNYVLQVEEAPVKLVIWHVDDGKKIPKGELLYDPSIHSFGYVSPFSDKDVSYIDVAIRKNLPGQIGTYEDIAIEFPTPLRLGSFLLEDRATVSGAHIALTIWIAESEGADIIAPYVETLDTMVAASEKNPVSFVVIEAMPAK